MSKRMAFPPVPGFDTAAKLRAMADRFALHAGAHPGHPFEAFEDIKSLILSAQEIEAYRLEVANHIARIHALERGVALRVDCTLNVDGEPAA